jgi:hypothetical protein
MSDRFPPKGERSPLFSTPTTPGAPAPSAFQRLEHALGEHLARLLVTALTTRLTNRSAENAAGVVVYLGPRVAAVEAHAEKDRTEREQPQHERRAALDPDREQATPDVESEQESPDEGSHPGIDARESQVHRAAL